MSPRRGRLTAKTLVLGMQKSFLKSAMTAPSSFSRATIRAGDEQLEKRRAFIVPKDSCG